MRSTTGRGLRRLRAAALIVTAAVLASTWYMYRDVHRTVETVRTRAALAMLDTAFARSALTQADSLALKSFNTEEIQIAGPGDQYQNQIAVASQSLAQVAEHNAGGPVASRHLQLVEGHLVAYTGLIAEADAHHRQGPATEALVVLDLWDASRLLHTPETGILAYLDKIQLAQQVALDDQLAGSSTTVWRILLLAVPAVLLLTLLVLAQLYIRRRFRRSVNAPLAAATLLLLLVCVLPVLGVVAQNRLETAAADLRQVIGTWESRTSTAVTTGQTTLRTLITAECPTECAGTLGKLTADPAGPAPAAAGPSGATQPDDRTLTNQALNVNTEIAAAGSNGDLEPLIPAGMLLTGALVLLGFRARIEEYRYQPT
jgi:hypothetical protein